MATCDYGVIAKKNGKIITTQFFTPMVETLGVTFDATPEGEQIEGRYFVYLGEADFYVAIYKGFLSIFSKNHRLFSIYGLDESKLPYKKYRHQIETNGVHLDIKRFDDAHRYYLRFWYQHNCYEAVYGYGIDQNINGCYHRTPRFMRRLKAFTTERD